MKSKSKPNKTSLTLSSCCANQPTPSTLRPAVMQRPGVNVLGKRAMQQRHVRGSARLDGFGKPRPSFHSPTSSRLFIKKRHLVSAGHFHHPSEAKQGGHLGCFSTMRPHPHSHPPTRLSKCSLSPCMAQYRHTRSIPPRSWIFSRQSFQVPKPRTSTHAHT